jgi:hypothetical protein
VPGTHSQGERCGANRRARPPGDPRRPVPPGSAG